MNSMQEFVCIVLLFFLLGCHSTAQDKRLFIEKENVQSMWIKCKEESSLPEMGNKWYKVGLAEYSKIVSEIHTAKKGVEIDSIKMRELKEDLIVDKLKIVLKQGDTVHLRFLRGSYIWQDSMFKTHLDAGGYLRTDLCIKCFANTLSIDSLWHKLITQSGCLVGGQHVENGSFGGQGCVMSASPFWEGFFDRNKEELTLFLVNKFYNKRETVLHACPFQNALEGELAVYCLHKIYLKNWYDFTDFQIYKNRKVLGSEDNSQIWLRRILQDKPQCEKLRNLWLKEMTPQLPRK